MSVHLLVVGAFAAVHVLVILRALLVDGRDPMSRAAWVLALLLLPGAGVCLYLLVGEPRMPPRPPVPWCPRRVPLPGDQGRPLCLRRHAPPFCSISHRPH